MANDRIVIYCDGACAGNQHARNKGGWGAVIQTGEKTEKLWGGERNTTNQRMEITACIKALESVNGSGSRINVYSDSAYLVNCINARWYVKWRQNGWQSSLKKPVENRDLWEKLLGLLQKHDVRFLKVAGHTGDCFNEMADRLAKQGIAGV